MSIQIQGTTVIDDNRKLVNTRLNNSVISTSTNAVAGTYYVATALLTLTLPTSPTSGDVVGFANQSATTSCVINRNGSNIMGLAEDMVVDKSSVSITLQYADATRGWIFV